MTFIAVVGGRRMERDAIKSLATTMMTMSCGYVCPMRHVRTEVDGVSQCLIEMEAHKNQFLFHEKEVLTPVIVPSHKG